MRIALVCETFLPDINGVTTMLCYLLEHLADRGHTALLIAPQGAPSVYAGAEVVTLGGVPLPFYPEIRLTPPQFGLTAHLRRFRPDLVHVVGPVALGAAIPEVVRRLSVPLVSSYHTNFAAYGAHYGFGGLTQAISGYLRWVHNRCDVTLCPSLSTLNELRAQGFRRLRVWARGVNTQHFHPRHRSEEWRFMVGAQPGEAVLLYVGRLAREKRVDLLLRAVAGLEGVRLVLVGDGPARQELTTAAQGLPVHFAGYLRDRALATAYASADIFAFPSDTETFGQVVQEAMSSGLPVVAVRSGGAVDLLSDGTSGLLVEPGSASELTRRLDQLVIDAPLRAAMGASGRSHAEQRSWPVVLDELLGHYHAALNPVQRAA